MSKRFARGTCNSNSKNNLLKKNVHQINQGNCMNDKLTPNKKAPDPTEHNSDDWTASRTVKMMLLINLYYYPAAKWYQDINDQTQVKMKLGN
ncbi:hypothetical protein Smp_162400 [Schistosoma mansoni]|uniref:hypothetical protein n=1 Tax=Schistosoma mansoni TaxID=6183 RepID=UPI0001A6274B|nr:hypothetical protein Smp_162400 [Schistosoma mansoni]|eukprot:XP_018646594.1 hypothetical protein Smp_162400 [Schistosoma mansoni]